MFAFVKIAYQFCKILIDYLIDYQIIFTFGDFKSSLVTYNMTVESNKFWWTKYLFFHFSEHLLNFTERLLKIEMV